MDKFKPICWHLPTPSKTKFPGSYPEGFERKIVDFIKTDENKILHLFSGSSKLGITVDIKHENNPDFVLDCHNLPFPDNSFDVVLADPPYSDKYAKQLYGTPKLRTTEWIMEAIRVLKPKGLLIHYHLWWLQRFDKYRCKFKGIIIIVTKPVCRPRVITIFEKD